MRKPSQTASPDLKNETCNDDLAGWVEKVRRLPDVRAHKIQAAREHLRNDGYDNNTQVLDTTLDRLRHELDLD